MFALCHTADHLNSPHTMQLLVFLTTIVGIPHYKCWYSSVQEENLKNTSFLGKQYSQCCNQQIKCKAKQKRQCKSTTTKATWPWSFLMMTLMTSLDPGHLLMRPFHTSTKAPWPTCSNRRTSLRGISQLIFNLEYSVGCEWIQDNIVLVWDHHLF